MGALLLLDKHQGPNEQVPYDGDIAYQDHMAPNHGPRPNGHWQQNGQPHEPGEDAGVKQVSAGLAGSARADAFTSRVMTGAGRSRRRRRPRGSLPGCGRLDVAAAHREAGSSARPSRGNRLRPGGRAPRNSTRRAPAAGILSSGRVQGDAAVHHEGHPVAELVGDGHVVGGQEDRLAARCWAG